MITNRKLMALLVALFIAAVAAGCSSEGSSDASKEVDFNEEGLPVVEDELVLDIAGRYSSANDNAKWNEKEIFKQLEEKTNVKVNWQLTPEQGWTEKKNLLLSSGNLPDVFLGLSSEDIPKYGSQGQLVELDDMIDSYAPNFKKILEKYPEVRKQITAPDGHIYTMPLGAFQDSDGAIRLWMNKKWLDNAGLEIPQTTEEFRTALKAFKEQDVNDNGDPDDELPYLHLYYDGAENYVNGVCKAFGVTSPDMLVKDGNVIYPMADEGYKDCIDYYGQLYDEGLINKDSFTITWDEYLARVAQGEDATVGVIYGYNPATTVQNDAYRDEYVAVPPLQSPDHDSIVPSEPNRVSQGAFAITSANNNPEATMRWIDQVYEPEMSLAISDGPNRLDEQEDGTYDRVTHPDDMTTIQWRYKESPVNYFVYFVDQEIKDLINESDTSDVEEWNAYYSKYIEGNEDEVVYPPVLFTAEESDEISRYKTDIMTYTNKMTAEWTVNGGLSDSEWDDYINTLEDMGLSDMIDVYQGAYDRYMSH